MSEIKVGDKFEIGGHKWTVSSTTSDAVLVKSHRTQFREYWPLELLEAWLGQRRERDRIVAVLRDFPQDLRADVLPALRAAADYFEAGKHWEGQTDAIRKD